MSIQLRTEDTGDAIRQATQYRNDNEADNHCHDVAEIVAAAFGKNSAEKDPEQRAICVTEDSQRNRDDPHIGMHNHEIGSNRCNNDHQHREPDRGPADRPQTLFVCRCRVDVGLVPIACETCGEGV